jgi:hypothetical protein
MAKIISKDEIITLAKKLATPVNFVELEKNGIIEKKGAWYKIKNIKTLPEHASKQIRSIRVDDKGNCFVQFPKSWKRAQLLYRKMTGKEYYE